MNIIDKSPLYYILFLYACPEATSIRLITMIPTGTSYLEIRTCPLRFISHSEPLKMNYFIDATDAHDVPYVKDVGNDFIDQVKVQK